jgi:hypothetical protein
MTFKFKPVEDEWTRTPMLLRVTGILIRALLEFSRAIVVRVRVKVRVKVRVRIRVKVRRYKFNP